MTQDKIDTFILSKGEYFDSLQLLTIKEQLLKMDDEKWQKLLLTDFKNPIIMLIISFIAGTFGIDRFLIGDIGLGIGKLITCGGFGFWTIIDWFLIMGDTKNKNLQNLQNAMF